MDTFLQPPEKEKGINKRFLLPLLIAAIIVIVAITAISLTRSTQQIHEQILEGALREDNSEFAIYTKKISIQTDEDRTTWSPTGMGTIVMSIRGNVRNITGKTLIGLEIKAAVVDSFGKMIKEKTVLVVPKQAERLENGQSLPVQVLIEGFNKDDDRAQIRWKVTAIKVE